HPQTAGQVLLLVPRGDDDAEEGRVRDRGHGCVPRPPSPGPFRARPPAGRPTTRVFAGTSRGAPAPPPTTAPAPMVPPGRMTAPLPTLAPRQTRVGSFVQVPAAAAAADGCRSLVNSTPWPMKTSSSMTTPSQMNVWLWMRQRRPTVAPRWISTKVP